MRAGWVIGLCAASFSCVAVAQELPSASVLRTTSAAGVPETTGGAVDRLLRARLDHIEGVHVLGGVTLDLAEAQLALGCMGETTECLAPIAEQIHADELVLPSLDRAGAQLVLGILLFDHRNSSLHRVVRRAEGEVELLDAIDGALRELFGLPALPEGQTDESSEEPLNEEVPPPPELSAPELLGPTILLASGLALAAGACISGAFFLDEDNAYRAPPLTEDDVMRLPGHLSNAQALAATADVLWIAAGVALVTGVTWLIVGFVTRQPVPAPTTARVIPMLAPGLAGLAVQGTL